jgi:hypothetical protein
VNVDDKGADDCGEIEGSEKPRLAAGTGRSAGMNNAPTEPLAAVRDGELYRAPLFQLSPTRPVRRQAAAEAELAGADAAPAGDDRGPR